MHTEVGHMICGGSGALQGSRGIGSSAGSLVLSDLGLGSVGRKSRHERSEVLVADDTGEGLVLRARAHDKFLVRKDCQAELADAMGVIGLKCRSRAACSRTSRW